MFSFSNGIICFPKQVEFDKDIDFQNNLIWEGNSTDCPCNGVGCIIDLSSIEQSIHIINVHGRFDELVLPLYKTELSLDGELFVGGIEIHTELVVNRLPLLINDITSFDVIEIEIIGEEEPTLILNSTFNIGSLTNHGKVEIYKNGHIIKCNSKGKIRIEQSATTIGTLIHENSLINLNGNLILINGESSITNTKIVVNELSINNEPIICQNGIIFDGVVFDVNDYEQYDCDKNLLTLVSSVFGNIYFTNSSIDYKTFIFSSKQYISEMLIQIELKNVNCERNYIYLGMLITASIFTVFCLLLAMLITCTLTKKLCYKHKTS
ncbi:Uncharacterized protein QTN25_002501 [Entamoeba marina]